MSTTIDPLADSHRTRRKASKKTKSSGRREATSLPATASRESSNDLSPSAAAERAVGWRESAHEGIRKPGLPPAEQWKQFVKRRRKASLDELLRAGRTSLGWGFDEFELDPLCRRLWSALDESRSKRTRRTSKGKSTDRTKQINVLLTEWLEFIAGSPSRLNLAATGVAACHLIAAHARGIDSTLAWSVLDALWRLALDAQSIPLDLDASADDALAEQLLAGELPLTLSWHFAPMRMMHRLRGAGRQRLSAGLDELLNGDGLPQARRLAVLRPLVASWTRAAAMGADWSAGAWPMVVQREFAQSVRQAIRWTNPVGAPLLASQNAAAWPADFLAAAVRWAGVVDAARSARLPMPILKRSDDKSHAAKRSKKGKLAPADDSDWSGLAVLRTDWSKNATTIAVDYSGGAVLIDAWIAGRRLFGGAWLASATLDERPLEPAGAWEQVCWVSDDDVDYLELMQPLAGGGQFERQLILARGERMLFVCDHLRAPTHGALSFASRLPLAENVVVEPAGETRDFTLRVGKHVLKAMPAGLPEWRIESRGGEVAVADGLLELRQQAMANIVACPLVIDLDGRRSKKECTWRQLTVAEALALQSTDVAVAYRAQSGDDQWVFYRSQAKRGNRTFIGQNTSSEFLAGRFKPKTGGVKTLIEIEG